MKIIENLEQWNILAAAMKEKDYRLWQFQYGYDRPEGLHAWFWRKGRDKDVEVVTHNKEVQEAILIFPTSREKNKTPNG